MHCWLTELLVLNVTRKVDPESDVVPKNDVPKWPEGGPADEAAFIFPPHHAIGITVDQD